MVALFIWPQVPSALELIVLTHILQHYNSPNHSLADARLTVVDRANALNTRLRLEEAWITALSTHQPEGLNQRM